MVDDASTDHTPQLLADEADAGELTLRVVRRATSEGPGAARNDGWRIARAPLVAFTDDDCVVDERWLEVGVRTHAEHPDAVIQGRTDPIPSELHLQGPFSRTLRVHALGPYFQTCNIFYPRALLHALGGFNAAAFTGPGGEDTDLAWRAIESGAPTVFAHDAHAFHAVSPLGPLGRLRIAARWSETVQVFRRHPELRKVHLQYRVFWSGSHYLLLRAVIALLLRRRVPFVVRNWLAAPYVAYILQRGRYEGGGGPLLAPYWFVHDLVEIVAVLRGSIRYRTFVL